MPQQNEQSWIHYFPPPLWAARTAMMMVYLARRVRIGDRYPLDDKVNSLSCRPLLILSSGRAGTTLLRSMLAAGNQIAIPPETQVLYKAVLKFSTLQHLEWGDLCRLIIALFESHSNFKMWQANLAPAYCQAIELPPHERSLARLIDAVFQCYAAEKFPEARVLG